MKNYVFVLLFLILFLGFSQHKEKAETQHSIKKQVNIILDNWHKAAAEANFENYFNLMDSVSVFIGTDASENWNKKEFKAYSKPYFDKGKAWSFKALERNIYTNTDLNFVWFDELLDTQMGTCRGSGVLVKKDNTWKIKHYVLSIAIPNADISKVIEAKKKNDAAFLEKFKN
ncbi:nuclear transport factor 2 family protein [Polaribacter sargassicola]|uniref:nuclear transport factor 2 family protein n=1 Tax=Polaribacter sargassicola TaxID=2836891 RepID=UPI001F1B2CCE|nr:nuclear transport factor 2 family protein [Polaribacter sp. DS7-9]MCG1035404.1 nuclear transport factor 2 family protein [Polaribacter sp. DS7-9]